MMYKRYEGNTGRYVLVEEPESVTRPQQHAPVALPPREEEREHRHEHYEEPARPPGHRNPHHGHNNRPPPGNGGGLGGLLGGVSGGLGSLLGGNSGGLGGLGNLLGGAGGLGELLGGSGAHEGGGLLGGILPDGLEMEDLILMLMMYLLYKESGDREWLIIMGALFFL